ncbi:hypothetical protein FPZ24_01965 [Sphingomonas panacisoli]|uniref:Peptidase C39 domain-containing protein n=1 Tax=Sphingomonas panacisoli TaxID=1813879 RepID=A0A5B8LGW5_9SPHN|nr:hypothetical protein [Sphingomonas panacisoli]QDZ06390.1 hypothetical protein FPZ24_01965 [Sphingomonas panacisoli]
MKTVYQRTESDCGVAALAMLADVSYEQALEFLRGSFRHTRIISSGKILAGVTHFGRTPLGDRCIRIGERQLCDLDHNALLRGVLIEGQRKFGHWAIWDCFDQTIRDPYAYMLPFETLGLLEVSW